MFDHLVKSMMYRAEIWEWKEYEEVVRIYKIVARVRLEHSGIDIVMEKTKRQLLRTELGKRAIKFEEKIKMNLNSNIYIFFFLEF